MVKRYQIKHTPLPEMRLDFFDKDGGALYIEGDYDQRLNAIDHLMKQLVKFRKECYRFVDQEKNNEIVRPYIEEVDRLTAELEKIKGEV